MLTREPSTATGRYWPLLVGVLAIALSVVHASPRYDLLSADDGEPGGIMHATKLKGLHPLTHLEPSTPTSHEAKLDFRPVAPLVLRPFGASSIASVLLSAICGVVSFALLAARITSLGVPPRTAVVALIGLACTAAGGTFILGFRYFDPLAVALVLGAMSMRRFPVLGATFALAALFTDERAIVAFVIAVLAERWIQKAIPNAAQPVLSAYWAAGVIAFYVVARAGLEATTNLETVRAGVGIGVAIDGLARWPLALIAGFAAWWIVIVAGLQAANRIKPAAPLVAAATAGVLSALLVADVTRSLVYILPIVPAATASLLRATDTRTLDRRLTAIAIICFLVPSFTMLGSIYRNNPLPINVIRWLTS